MKYTILIMVTLLLFNCKKDKAKNLSAQTIIDTAIDISGGSFISASTIDFDFRDKHYKATRNGGDFTLEREFNDVTSHSVSEVRDILSNKGFERYLDDLFIEIPDSMATRYTASVNSVHYFSVLPYGLNDEAVNKTLLGSISIKNKFYHAIQVTFNQHGGGEDFEDVFVYWVNKKTNTVDYLAYSYDESDGKGIRFREAYNERYIEGIRFVDYNNYKPEDNSVSLTDLPQLFENGTLKLLSKIELENVTVLLN